MNELPTSFGKYYLTEKIATGGMAEIYLAKLLGPGGFEKQLIIKQIHPELSGQRTFVDMFVAEAKTLVSLGHGNIVPIYELGMVDDVYFIAMDYIDGPTLRELAKALSRTDAAMSPAVAAYIAAEILKGLDYAHRKGVIHRDVSPRNVMLSRDGEVKLLDFGIAIQEGEIQSSLKPVGSYPYMSPEQVRGQPLTVHSDLFSTGVLLWEMLTGHELFARPDADDTLHAVTDAAIAAPSARRPSAPSVLDELCLRALARDPGERYSSAAEFLAPLNRFLYSLEELVTPTALSRLVAKHCPPVVQRPSEPDIERPPDQIRTVSDRPTGRHGTVKLPRPSAAPAAAAAPDRTRPLPNRRYQRRASTVRTFATHAAIERVLGKEPPLFPADNPADDPADNPTDDPADDPAGTGDDRRREDTAPAASSTRTHPRRASTLRDLPGKPEPGPGVTPISLPTAPHPPGTRRRRWGAAIGLAAVLLLGVGVGAAITRNASPNGAAAAGASDAGPDQDASPARDAAKVGENATPRATIETASEKNTEEDAAVAAPDAKLSRNRPARADPQSKPESKPESKPDRTGQLKVGANPWAEVYIDGRKLGRAPRAWPVPAGEHVVEVVFPVAGREAKKTFTVTIRPGETTSLGVIDFSGDL